MNDAEYQQGCDCFPLPTPALWLALPLVLRQQEVAGWIWNDECEGCVTQGESDDDGKATVAMKSKMQEDEDGDLDLQWWHRQQYYDAAERL